MSILKKFDHIGIVVEDLQKAKDELFLLFGLECHEEMELKDAGIKMAFYPLGDGQMEFIQFQKPLDDVDPIATRPRAGVQHVAFQVEDVDEAIKQLKSNGLRLVKGFPRKGAHGMVAYFYPTKGLDMLIEICQHGVV